MEIELGRGLVELMQSVEQYYTCLWGLQPFVKMMALAGFSLNQEIMEMGQNLGPAGLLHIVEGYAVHINSIEMFVRVQYTNLSSFYCIEARALLLYNATDIAFALLTTPSVLTQSPRQESGRY
jgi:hypothetical protein